MDGKRGSGRGKRKEEKANGTGRRICERGNGVERKEEKGEEEEIGEREREQFTFTAEVPLTMIG